MFTVDSEFVFVRVGFWKSRQQYGIPVNACCHILPSSARQSFSCARAVSSPAERRLLAAWLPEPQLSGMAGGAEGTVHSLIQDWRPLA